MSYEVTDEPCDIDLSKLISFSMSFQPLQLLFQSFFKRVKQAEDDNERQDGEIDQLKRAIEEMRRRDAEREAQIQELQRQQEKYLQDEREEKQPERSESDVVPCPKDSGQPVDLRSLWNEVEKIKKLLGEFYGSGRRHTIEELYKARKRKSSLLGGSLETRQGKSSTVMGEAGVDGGDAKVGDAILDRAKEELVVSEDSHLLTFEQESGAPPGETMEPPRLREETTVLESVQQELEATREVERQQAQEQVSARESPFGKWTVQPGDKLSAGDDSVPSRVQSGQERHGYSHGHEGFVVLPSDQSASFGAPISINDRLRQDSRDIEYLNRVVAEMLNEMKGLHADVDLMRTVSAGGGASVAPLSVGEKDVRERAELQRRVKALEEVVSELKKQAKLPTEGSAPMAKVDIVTRPSIDTSDDRRTSLMDDLRRLKDRVDAVDQTQERMNSKLESALGAVSASQGDTGVSPAHLAVMDATVKMLEKQLADLQNLGLRNYEGDLETLRQAVAKLQGETTALERACALLDEKKEDKSSRRILSKEGSKDEKEKQEQTFPSLQLSSTPAVSSPVFDLNDLLRRLEEMQQRLSQSEANIKELDEEKADRSALQRINDDLRQLRQFLELEAGKRGDDVASSSAAAMQEELLQKVQQQIQEHVQNFNKTRDGTTGELDALRSYVEQIDHCKADAKLVANKAERDYVENALERLMREVEQVLNATNAGLIDTLDKSLNVLRDILDGKATKNDVDHLRRLVSEEHVGSGAPDALVGFRGFRCLGCNRTVETMRPRIMGSRLQPFVNRLPQNHPADPVAARIQQGSSVDGDAAPTMLKNN